MFAEATGDFLNRGEIFVDDLPGARGDFRAVQLGVGHVEDNRTGDRSGLDRENGKVEQMPVLEGKRMTIFIAPKKVQAKKPAAAAPAPEVKKAERSQPKANAPKEYTGPRVEGED